MTAIGTPLYDEKLEPYLLIAEGEPSRPNAYYEFFSDFNLAKRTAMAWLIAGFSSRIIDLKLDQKVWQFQNPTIDLFTGNYMEVTPEIADRYINLAKITQEAAKFDVVISRYSLQLVPPIIPDYIQEDVDFFNWLKELSLSPPTWDGTKEI